MNGNSATYGKCLQDYSALTNLQTHRVSGVTDIVPQAVGTPALSPCYQYKSMESGWHTNFLSFGLKTLSWKLGDLKCVFNTNGLYAIHAYFYPFKEDVKAVLLKGPGRTAQ
jgi:hypothetical protein